MNLYNKFAKNFSQTRNRPWEGWTNILEFIPKKKYIKVLDLGCGNGRFLEFLTSKLPSTDIEYVGIDSSSELLKIAKENFNEYPNSKFIQKDLELDEWDKNVSEFDLVVGFGLMHHISSLEKRLSLLKKSSSLLKKEGIMVFTYWQFANNESFLKKHVVRKLAGENDYILSFGKEAQRFCHHFTDEEVESLYEATPTLKIVKDFQSDGFEGKMNKYVFGVVVN